MTMCAQSTLAISKDPSRQRQRNGRYFVRGEGQQTLKPKETVNMRRDCGSPAACFGGLLLYAKSMLAAAGKVSMRDREP